MRKEGERESGTQKVQGLRNYFRISEKERNFLLCKKVVENEVERDRLRYYEEEGKEREKLEKERLVKRGD